MVFSSKFSCPSLVLSLIFAIFWTATSALTCLESDDEGNFYPVYNSTWKYCVLLPQSGDKPAQAYGAQPDIESYLVADRAFAESLGPEYTVLTFCVFERYRMPSVHGVMINSEHLFRCYCNYDECNRHQHFSSYLKGLRKDNP
ncbi:unnamed protein product, partial [Mesorhabditis belari]|uniref:Uncharacterized protein n=1 Tax=Mesorhabditis belari TaxID=2138241 RepID=A0AAF3FDJ4_9BILA